MPYKDPEKNIDKVKELRSTEEFKKAARERQKKHRKKRDAQTKEKYKQYDREWAKKNPDKIKEYRRKQYLKNKDKPAYKAIKNLRARLIEVLKGRNKSNGSMLLLGCSIEFFREYIESKFEPGMTWENYGNPNGDHSNCWHVDHIKPCCSFDLSDPEQQKICFHYTNLQPLWGKDNLRKNKY